MQRIGWETSIPHRQDCIQQAHTTLTPSQDDELDGRGRRNKKVKMMEAILIAQSRLLGCRQVRYLHTRRRAPCQ